MIGGEAGRVDGGVAGGVDRIWDIGEEVEVVKGVARFVT